jgi:hypothetical protein
VNMSTTTGEVASIKKEFATLSKSTESIPKANDDDKFQTLMAVSFAGRGDYFFFCSFFFFFFFFDLLGNLLRKLLRRLTLWEPRSRIWKQITRSYANFTVRKPKRIPRNFWVFS